MELCSELYSLTRKFPQDERFGLVSQINRSAFSIPSTTTEVCSRSSEPEFKRFLEISLGSSFELETQLILPKDFTFLNEDEFMSVFQKLEKIPKGLNLLITKINSVTPANGE